MLLLRLRNRPALHCARCRRRPLSVLQLSYQAEVVDTFEGGRQDGRETAVSSLEAVVLAVAVVHLVHRCGGWRPGPVAFADCGQYLRNVYLRNEYTHSFDHPTPKL